MANDIIQAEYEALETIVKTFEAQSDIVDQMLQNLNNRVEDLRSGGWEGQGADAFYQEYDGEITPAVKRLSAALIDGSTLSNQIIDIFQQAEAEAAGQVIFDDGGVPGAGPGGGPGGGPGVGPGGAPGGSGVPPAGGAGTGPFGGFTFKPASPTFGGNVFEYDYNKPSGERGEFKPSIGVKYGVGGAFYGDPNQEGFTAGGGEIGIGASVNQDGLTVGPYAQIYAAKAEYDTALLGGDNLGVTGGVGGQVLAADGFIGIKDNSFGASIGGTLVSAEGNVGVNVAGFNASVKGEIGLKAELGFSIGKETEIKLPFITIGFSFGDAKD